MPEYDAVIVGAGHNGLIAAAYLARAGLRSLVLEARDVAGGACVTEEIAGAPGFRVSTGAAQLGNLRPEIVRDLDLAAHGFALVTPEPLTVFPFPDGLHLALWTDPAQTRAEFAKFSARDAAALPGYIAECSAVCERIESLLYGDGVPSLDDIEHAFTRAGQAGLFRDFVLGSMADLLDARFEADATKAVLGYTATFGTNADPRAAAHHGAEIRTGAPVGRILMSNGAAAGVELATGETIRARAVISNADPQRTFLGLVGRSHLSAGFAEAIVGIEMQGVALKVNCALDRLPRFAAAPDGRHTLTCYAQFFPYDLAPSLGGWDRQRDAAQRIVLDTVAAYAPDVADCVIAAETLTPLDLERRFGMTGGHQFHGDLMPGQLFDRRPAPGCLGARTPIGRLYLCGAGAHPGGCIWGAPGQRAARTVAANLAG